MKKLMLILALGSIALAASDGWAAVTKTVKASGGDYTSLVTALSEVATWPDNAVTTWGDGDDTIIVSNDQTIPAVQDAYSGAMYGFVLRAKNGGKLTIKAADGTRPKLIADGTLDNKPMIKAASKGAYVIEGFTMLGPLTGEMRSFVLGQHEAIPSPLTENNLIDITLKNCLLTKNDGSGNPVTTYSSGTPGQFGRWFYVNDDHVFGPINFTIDGCTLAYASYLGFSGSRIANPTQASTLTAFNVTIKNSILINAASMARFFPVSNPMSLTIENSLLAKTSDHMFYAEPSSNISLDMPVTFRDSILATPGTGKSIIHFEDELAPLTIENSTIVGDAGRAAINILDYYMADNSAVMEAFTMKNVIISGPPLAWEVDMAAGGVSLENVACAAAGSGNGDIDAEGAALYGGTGPFTEDPGFLSTDLAVLNGEIGWRKGYNTLYDVGNANFVGKGDQGDPNWAPLWALLGGGDPGPGVPVELSSFQVE